MSVNHEVKGQLARLLATEDLVVEHKKVSTACFNVHTRVLTLPLWDRASNAVYDMLVAHEVGHALYTPDEDWTVHTKVPPSYVNIVEDVRIEKLMKRRYAGLGKTFFAGYKELVDQDFFDIGDDDLTTYSLADRVNLWFKVGNYTAVPIHNDSEKELIKLIESAETFADVLIAAEEMYKLSKEQKTTEQEITSIQNISESGETVNVSIEYHQTENTESQSSDNQSEGENTDQKQEDIKQKSQESINSAGDHDDPEVKTDQRLRDAIEQLSAMDPYQGETVYLELPELNLDSVIASNKEIYQYIGEFWNRTTDPTRFDNVDTEYRDFKNSAQKEVNYLVKEFECRKTADSYARASTARTGVLDCSKLHTYKYNEDLFKKVTTLADGKSHGLIFVLDWSGSMDRVLLDTLKQLYNLIWFCKKVSIPFEVYAFTNEWNCVTYAENNRAIMPKMHHTKKPNQLVIPQEFSLMNFFSSKTRGHELENQMLMIYRIAKSYRHRYCSPYSVPHRLSLSGTPLNESIVALNQIIPQFQQQNKLQKVHTIILTDGDANGLNYGVEVQRNQSEPYIGTRGFNPYTCYLRDRKMGCVYTMNRMYDNYAGFTDMLIRYLRNRYPNVSFIGMRVLASGEAISFMRRYLGNDLQQFEKTQQEWKKQKSFSIRTEGYHSYFGISGNSLSTDDQFVVNDNASKIEIRNAFKKYMNSKKVNKKVLNEFVELIA
jgi:Mg-chelatase subunit ChlD